MKTLLSITILALISPLSLSKTIKVETYNKLNNQNMVYSPTFLKADIGDKVVFIPKVEGHTSRSIHTPKGSVTWKSKTSKRIEVTLDKEGIYLYECANHGVMGMIGMIQVGNPKNLKKSKAFYKKHKKKMVLNKDRLDRFFQEIKKPL